MCNHFLITLQDTRELMSPTGRPDELSLNWQFLPGNAKVKKLSPSSLLTFSSIPTRPRDWVVMHALPKELKQWSASALYVIGNRSALHDVPADSYPNCTFVPVDVSVFVLYITTIAHHCTYLAGFMCVQHVYIGAFID